MADLNNKDVKGKVVANYLRMLMHKRNLTEICKGIRLRCINPNTLVWSETGMEDERKSKNEGSREG